MPEPFSPLTGGSLAPPSESFFEKYKIYLIGAAVVVVGFIVYQTMQKRKPTKERPELDQGLNTALGMYNQPGQPYQPPYYPQPGYPQPGPVPGVAPGLAPGLVPSYPAPPPIGGFSPVPGQPDASRMVPTYPTAPPGYMMPPPNSTYQPSGVATPGPAFMPPPPNYGPPSAAPMGGLAAGGLAAPGLAGSPPIGSSPMTATAPMMGAGSGALPFVGDLPNGQPNGNGSSRPMQPPAMPGPSFPTGYSAA